jgi:hypothetical protein
VPQNALPNVTLLAPNSCECEVLPVLMSFVNCIYRSVLVENLDDFVLVSHRPSFIGLRTYITIFLLMCVISQRRALAWPAPRFRPASDEGRSVENVPD